MPLTQSQLQNLAFIFQPARVRRLAGYSQKSLREEHVGNAKVFGKLKRRTILGVLPSPLPMNRGLQIFALSLTPELAQKNDAQSLVLLSRRNAAIAKVVPPGLRFLCDTQPKAEALAIVKRPSGTKNSVRAIQKVNTAARDAVRVGTLSATVAAAAEKARESGS